MVNVFGLWLEVGNVDLVPANDDNLACPSLTNSCSPCNHRLELSSHRRLRWLTNVRSVRNMLLMPMPPTRPLPTLTFEEALPPNTTSAVSAAIAVRQVTPSYRCRSCSKNLSATSKLMNRANLLLSQMMTPNKGFLPPLLALAGLICHH